MSTIEELPSLPSDWKWVSLEEIGKIITGKTPSKKNAGYYGDDIPFYKPTDLNADYYVKESHDNLSYQGAEQARLLPEKSVLVTCIGATIGKTGLIRKKGAFNQQINAIIPLGETIPEYIFYGIKSPQMQKQIKDNASATTLPILNKTKFEKLLFPLAPVSVQQNIVFKLDELFSQLDAGLDSLKRTKLLLNHYRQAVLKAAMTGELTKEWREKHQHELEPASVLLERILQEHRQKWEEEQLAKFQAKRKVPKTDSWKMKYKEPKIPEVELFKNLPFGWFYSYLEILLSKKRTGLKTGPFGTMLKKYEHQKQGIPVLGVENIESMKFKTGSKIHISENKAKELSGYDVLPGEIIISRSGTINQICVIPDGIGETRISTNIIRLASDKEILHPKYFCYLFKGSNFIKNQMQELCKGSSRLFLNQTILKNLVIPIPNLEEQIVMVKEIDKLFSILEKIETNISANLVENAYLRNSILKSAFEGKLVLHNSETKNNEKI